MLGIRALIETGVVLAVIVGANALFGWSDPGWVSLNPTPYLLVPLLLGLRYGFAAGVLAGGAAVVVSTLWAGLAAGAPWLDVLGANPFAVLALPALGAIAGELHRSVLGRADASEERLAMFEEQFERLSTELALSHDSRAQLQDALALHGAEFCSADLELRALFAADAGDRAEGLLATLDRLCSVSEAAFYQTGSKGEFEREASHGGPGDRLPGRLRDTDPAGALARAALDAGKLVTARELWEGGAKPSTGAIAALPWPDGDRVLVIADMPFAAVQWQNFARIELFCRWVANTEADLETGGPPAAVVDGDAFRRRLELAAASAADAGPSSTVLLFSGDGAKLRDSVVPKLRPADLAASLGDGSRLAVLLPMSGGRDAEALVDQVGDGVACEAIPVRGRGCADEIWNRLNDVA